MHQNSSNHTPGLQDLPVHGHCSAVVFTPSLEPGVAVMNVEYFCSPITICVCTHNVMYKYTYIPAHTLIYIYIWTRITHTTYSDQRSHPTSLQAVARDDAAQVGLFPEPVYLCTEATAATLRQALASGMQVRACTMATRLHDARLSVQFDVLWSS